ncbi:lectizyme [Drosophila kikkawai]|uniref:Lectizyme n=1 Tax=Drosophila kikkawai TaxID=30033 RepID=A0A6P4JC10_DROKI|nr:lectizyme [Drosophila kikkawai]
MRQFVVLLALALASLASGNLIVKPGFPEGRIINGYEAKQGEAPYIVSLHTTSHFCAGSLIAADWILTAAHCMTYTKGTASAGVHGRSDTENVQSRDFTNAQYIIHEKYGGGVGPYDIGLIKLDKPFDLNVVARDGSNPVGVISLPSNNYQADGLGLLFGWGRDNSGLLPNALQKLDVDIIGYTKCKAALPSTAPLAESNVCTYTENTTDGACNGDSGGPLVQNGELVGVVSWGYTPCATTKYPSVYTQVSSYNSWIKEKMNA